LTILKNASNCQRITVNEDDRMSDYQSGYNAGRSAAQPHITEVMAQQRYQHQVDAAFRDHANQYQHLLNKYESLVDEYNDLVRRFNLRGEALDLGEKRITHAKNAANILEKGFRYQTACHAMLMKLPYLATTDKQTGGRDQKIRDLVAELRELPDGEQEYQDLVEHIEDVGRSIADNTVLSKFLQNEVNILRLSPTTHNAQQVLDKYLYGRDFLYQRTNNIMPVHWPDRPQALQKIMDTAKRVTEKTLEQRFLHYFFQSLTIHTLNAILAHMAQGKNCQTPEPVSAAFAYASQQDVFPLFPENMRSRFSATLAQNLIGANNESLGVYYDWLRSQTGIILNAMDEFYLMRTGNLAALRDSVPHAATLDHLLPPEAPKKVVNGFQPNTAQGFGQTQPQTARGFSQTQPDTPRWPGPTPAASGPASPSPRPASPTSQPVWNPGGQQSTENPWAESFRQQSQQKTAPEEKKPDKPYPKWGGDGPS
jgi:hypothetical protein